MNGDGTTQKTSSTTTGTTKPLTESTATKALQKRLYFGIGKKFLGFQFADEEQQEDGSFKKLGKDGFRHWKVPTDAVLRRRWCPLHEHLKGLHRGVVADGSSHVPFVAADLDRHHESVDPKDHIRRVLRAGRLLRMKFPHFCWLAEVNSRNGSMKFFGFGYVPIPIAEAQKIARQIHELLLQHGCGAVNHRGIREVEVFPFNCVQVGLPMRADKVTIVSSGLLEKCVRRKKSPDGAMLNFETYSALSLLREFRNRGCYDEDTLLRELKKACANLPFVPATGITAPEIPVLPIQPEEVSVSSKIPRSRGDYRNNPNAYERQEGGLLEYCQRIGRVAAVEEGLKFIRTNRLYSGEWTQNEVHRRCRVAHLLKRIAKTFDPTKCSSSKDRLDIEKINIGKFGQWCRNFVGKVAGTNRSIDEYGDVVERRSVSVDSNWVSVFLSVVEYCCVTCPNDDGSLPQDRAEQIWLALYEAGRISVKWDDRKWKVARDWLEQRGVIRIVDRNWRFRHGNGKAMRWAVGEGFERLHVWWRSVKESSGNPAVPLEVFLKNMSYNHSLNSYSHTGTLKPLIPSSEWTSRGPPR